MALAAYWVPSVLSALAILMSGLALYLQRRDKRPRLKILASDKGVASMLPDGMGGWADGPEQPGQSFTIRNVGLRKVQIHSVEARWLFGRPFPVSADRWSRTPELEPDSSCECAVVTSKLMLQPATRARRMLPFYRVEFLDPVGRRWTPGYRRFRRG